MRRVKIIVLLFLILSTSMHAQDYVPSRDDISAFFNTKTLVVLLDNPMLEYNIEIKEVMEQEWNITEFDFISFKEFEKISIDAIVDFLTRVKSGDVDLPIRADREWPFFWNAAELFPEAIEWAMEEAGFHVIRPLECVDFCLSR